MTRQKSNLPLYTSLFLFILIFLFVPLVSFAQGYIEMVGLPGVSPNAQSTQEYINALLRIAIIAGALIAVIKIILAGAKYVLADVVTDKGEAKKDIRTALIGLLIIMAAVTILRTINPDLVMLQPLVNAPSFYDRNPPNSDPPNPPDPPPNEDGSDVASSEAACTALENSTNAGYVFKIYSAGTSLNPYTTTECCIPNSTGETACRSDDTVVETDTGVDIDTAKLYTSEEYNALLAEIRATGARVVAEQIALGNDEDVVARCQLEDENAKGYTIRKIRGIDSTAPERWHLCVIPPTQ